MFIESIPKTDPSSVGAAYVAPMGLASYYICFFSINIWLLTEPFKS